MDVYRIEHPDNGLGPYQQDRVMNTDGATARYALGMAMNTRHSSDPERSIPRTDGNWTRYTDWTEQHFVALTTREGVAWWFEGFGRRLSKLGYVMSVYSIHNRGRNILRTTSDQVLFRKDRAKLLGTEYIWFI